MKTKAVLIIAIITAFASNTYCQPTPPATHGNNVTASQPQSAPIGTSTALLLSLATVYTTAKLYNKKKEENKENNSTFN